MAVSKLSKTIELRSPRMNRVIGGIDKWLNE